VRLTFSPSPTADGGVTGGWWPRTRDPATELPALATAVAERLGVVRKIALNADAWPFWPREVVITGGPKVRLDWCTGDAHTIRLTGVDASHLDLLVIPPDTPAILALTCLARAARDMLKLGEDEMEAPVEIAISSTRSISAPPLLAIRRGPSPRRRHPRDRR
jgi:hypothetical protein